MAHFCKLVEEPFNNSRSTRQKVVRYRLVRDGFTHRASDFASRAEMNAAPDAGKPHFDGGVGEALIRHRHAGQGGRTQREGRLVTQKQPSTRMVAPVTVEWVEMYSG